MIQLSKYGVIYKTTCLINGKIYIGQQTYKNEKLKYSYFGSGKIIKQKIKQYGKKNFTKNILIECNSQEELDAYEELFIELYSSTNPIIGYNILSGSSYSFGNHNPSKIESCRIKISKNWYTSETTKGKQNPFYGKKHTKETKEYITALNLKRSKQISDDLKERWKCDEMKKAVSESRSVRIICLDVDKKIITIYKSIKECKIDNKGDLDKSLQQSKRTRQGKILFRYTKVKLLEMIKDGCKIRRRI